MADGTGTIYSHELNKIFINSIALLYKSCAQFYKMHILSKVTSAETLWNILDENSSLNNINYQA